MISIPFPFDGMASKVNLLDSVVNEYTLPISTVKGKNNPGKRLGIVNMAMRQMIYLRECLIILIEHNGQEYGPRVLIKSTFGNSSIVKCTSLPNGFHT